MEEKVTLDGAKPVLIAKQFKFTEGPAVDKEGNVFFTDQPEDKIWKFDTAGKLSVFLDKAGRSNGMYFDNKGNLISCADEKNELWSISPKKKITVLVKGYKGKKLNGPNDVSVHPGGNIYFTDPYYQRYYWKRREPDLDAQRVYLLQKGKKEPIAVASTLQKPNGIIGTPDGKTLYVADIDGNKTYKFQINPDGTLGEPVLFAEQGSDGMTLDNNGNVYLTGNGVTIYNPAGKKIEFIDIPEPWTGNICFAGRLRNKLFITASTAIYTVDMKVRGIE